MAAPPLDSPYDGPVAYPGDTEILVKSSKGRSGPTLNTSTRRSGYNTYRGWTQTDYQNKHYNINRKDEGT